MNAKADIHVVDGLARHDNGYPCPDCAGWVDAARVAEYLGTDRETVYRSALRLDGSKIGEGPKAPWRFKLALVDAALDAMTERITCSPSRGSEEGVLPLTTPIQRHLRSRRMGTEAPLLPIRGEKPPSQAA